jgi:hypothetical protein
LPLLGKVLIEGSHFSQLPESFFEKLADLLVASGELCGNRVKQRSDVIFDCDLSNLTESYQTCIVKPFLTTRVLSVWP